MDGTQGTAEPPSKSGRFNAVVAQRTRPDRVARQDRSNPSVAPPIAAVATSAEWPDKNAEWPATAMVLSPSDGRPSAHILRLMKPIPAIGPNPKATIDDVANLAGVSTSTVSRFLNGRRVGSANAITDAIATLGFRPSAAARSLKSGSSSVIGFLVPDIANPFFGSALRGIESVAREHGFNLLVGNSDEDPVEERAALGELLRHGLDGLVFTPTVEWPGEIEMLLGLQLPVVLFDRVLSRQLFDSVLIDNAGGSRQAVRHLIALGHRRIGLVTGPLHKTPDIERRRGYMDAMAEAGIPIQDDLLEIADCMEAGGYQSALRLVGRPT
jgi:LacI family transcriptional regulator